MAAPAVRLLATGLSATVDGERRPRSPTCSAAELLEPVGEVLAAALIVGLARRTGDATTLAAVLGAHRTFIPYLDRHRPRSATPPLWAASLHWSALHAAGGPRPRRGTP